MALDFFQPTINAIFTGVGVAIGQYIFGIWKKHLFEGKKHKRNKKK